jgi:hypothetical protein
MLALDLKGRMPQTIPWQPLDGDWFYGIVWCCEPLEAPQLFLHLRDPGGREWSIAVTLHGANDPNRPRQTLVPVIDVQADPETP